MDPQENIMRPPAAETGDAATRSVLRRYYGVWAAYSLAGGFLYGVYPIFLRTRGLSEFEINSVLAIYFAVTFLTDIPTGAFADALGRRRSFALGCALRSLAFMVYFFAYHYPMFVLGETIDGIGTTFCNGSIDAWGVDALDQAGYRGLKDRLFWRISQLMNLGFMLAAIAGAAVANINIAWPWLMGASGYFLCAWLIAPLMREANPRHADVALRALPSVVKERVVEGFRQAFRTRTFLLLTLAQGIFFAAWAPYWLQWPQFFTIRYGIGIWIVGWIFALFTIARMVGAEFMIHSSIERPRRARWLSVLAVAVAGLMYAAGSLGARTTLTLLVFCGFSICAGALMPFAQSWINEEIHAETRATLLSFRSTCETFGGSIGLLLTGVVADRAGLQASWRLAGLLSLLALPCYLTLALRARATRGSALAEAVGVR